MLATRFIAGRIEGPGRWRYFQLCRHDPQQWRMRGLARAQHTAGVAKVGHLHRDETRRGIGTPPDWLIDNGRLRNAVKPRCGIGGRMFVNNAAEILIRRARHDDPE